MPRLLGFFSFSGLSLAEIPIIGVLQGGDESHRMKEQPIASVFSAKKGKSFNRMPDEAFSF